MNTTSLLIGKWSWGDAVRRAELVSNGGFKTAIVDAIISESVCAMDWGCIPTKALIKSAQVRAHAKLPNLPQDGKKIIGYRQALTLPNKPKSMVVVGSGAIGVEFAYFYNAMGTQDEEYPNNWRKSLKKQVFNILTKSEVAVCRYKEGVYAIGDIVKGQALAHVASAEAITCVEKIKGLHVEAIDYNNIPGCTYCSPEIASVGYTEKAAKEAGYELKVGKFPFSASGKSSAAGAKDAL
ncbi:hypothetical protein FQR65_LT16508 [Abscondita terminalis]|nr:hypothetical protein FQR65_LT16508 [Abscondita terminalis]